MSNIDGEQGAPIPPPPSAPQPRPSFAASPDFDATRADPVRMRDVWGILKMGFIAVVVIIAGVSALIGEAADFIDNATDSDVSDALLASAQQLARSGQSAKALAAYDELLSDDLSLQQRTAALVSRSRLHLDSADLELARNDVFEAVEFAESAPDARTDVVGALEALALAYLMDDGFYSAIEAADQGLRLEPNSAALLKARGTARLEIREFETAITDLKASLEIEAGEISVEGDNTNFASVAQAYIRLGDALQDLGEYDDAIVAYDDSIASTSENVTQSFAFAQRAYVLQEIDRGGEAKADLDRAIELDPKNGTAHVYRSYYYTDLGEFDRALADAERALDLNASDDDDRSLALFARSRARWNLGDELAALDDIDESIALSEQLSEPAQRSYQLRANIKIALGDNQGAISDASNAIENGTTDIAALDGFYRTRGRALMADGQFEAALDDVDAALGLGGSDTYSLQLQGDIQDAMGDLAGAVQSYEAAIDTAPDDAWARYWLGEIFYRNDDFQSAEVRYREALELDAEQAAFHSGIGHNLFQQDRIAEAIVAFTESLSLDGTDPYVLYARGLSHYISYNDASARSDLEEALQAAGNDSSLIEEINSLLSEIS